MTDPSAPLPVDPYAVPWDGSRFYFRCEAGHRIVSAKRDIGPTCTAPTRAGVCGEDIEWRQIPYVPGEARPAPTPTREQVRAAILSAQSHNRPDPATDAVMALLSGEAPAEEPTDD